MTSEKKIHTFSYIYIKKKLTHIFFFTCQNSFYYTTVEKYLEFPLSSTLGAPLLNYFVVSLFQAIFRTKLRRGFLWDNWITLYYYFSLTPIYCAIKRSIPPLSFSRKGILIQFSLIFEAYNCLYIIDGAITIQNSAPKSQ